MLVAPERMSQTALAGPAPSLPSWAGASGVRGLRELGVRGRSSMVSGITVSTPTTTVAFADGSPAS